MPLGYMGAQKQGGGQVGGQKGECEGTNVRDLSGEEITRLRDRSGLKKKTEWRAGVQN